MTANTAAHAPTVVLDIHVCAQRRTFRVTFEGPNAEAMAIAFCTVRESTHAVWEVDTAPIDYSLFPLLSDYLHPTCEHGLSASNCYGPQHYYFDEEEQARGYFNS